MPENPKLKNLTPKERNLTSELRNLTAIPEIIYKDYYKEYTTTTDDVVVVRGSNPITGIVSQEEEKGQGNSVKSQSGAKNLLTDFPEIDRTIGGLKREIDAVTGGSIAPKAVRSLVEHCGEDRVQYYINNFHKFTQVQNINNTVGFFIKAVEDSYSLPISSMKKNRWGDGMMQHEPIDFKEIEKAIQERNLKRFSLNWELDIRHKGQRFGRTECQPCENACFSGKSDSCFYPLQC